MGATLEESNTWWKNSANKGQTKADYILIRLIFLCLSFSSSETFLLDPFSSSSSSNLLPTPDVNKAKNEIKFIRAVVVGRSAKVYHWMGCCHSSVDSSAPSILRPWVRVSSPPSTLLSIYIWFVSCRKDENKLRRPGLAHFLAKVYHWKISPNKNISLCKNSLHEDWSWDQNKVMRMPPLHWNKIGGGLVVSTLAFYFVNPQFESRLHLRIFCKIVFEEQK